MIFIPFNTPSSKNSKIATKNGVFHSKTVMKYLRNLGIQNYSVTRKTVKGYVRKPNLFLLSFKDKDLVEYTEAAKFPPIKIGFHFVRDSDREADFHNLVQVVMDLLVAHHIIEDDNMNCVLPFPLEINNKYYSYNKENPGVYIKIL